MKYVFILTLLLVGAAAGAWGSAIVVRWNDNMTQTARIVPGERVFSMPPGVVPRNGDIIIPLTGLWLLVPPQTNDQMTVTAKGDPAQSNQAVGNPDALKPIQISIGGPFAAQQTIPITRGQITTAATLAKLSIPGITLQST